MLIYQRVQDVTSSQWVITHNKNPKYQLTNSIAQSKWCHMVPCKCQATCFMVWWLRSLFPRSQFSSLEGSGLDQTGKPKYVQRLIDFFWPNSLHRSSTWSFWNPSLLHFFEPMGCRQREPREPQIIGNGRPFLETSLSIWPFLLNLEISQVVFLGPKDDYTWPLARAT